MYSIIGSEQPFVIKSQKKPLLVLQTQYDKPKPKQFAPN